MNPTNDDLIKQAEAIANNWLAKQDNLNKKQQSLNKAYKQEAAALKTSLKQRPLKAAATKKQAKPKGGQFIDFALNLALILTAMAIVWIIFNYFLL